MGYRDQKIIRDTRDLQAAKFIGATGEKFRQGIQDQRERQEADDKTQKELQQKAQASVAGRYKEIADYKKTGNKSIDDQVIKAIEEAALAESAAYMSAFGNEGNPDAIAAYQKTQATNSRDLNDLTMFVGSFDKDLDEAANAIANGSTLMPGAGDFAYELDIQNGGPVDLKRGADGRWSLFGGASGNYAGKELSLGKYYDDFENNGTRYEMIDDDYGLVMDEWSKGLIENGDALYKQTQQTGGSTKIATGKKDGGKGTKVPGVKGNVYNTQGYKADIIRKLRSSNKNGNIASSIKGAPPMTIQQIFHQVQPLLLASFGTTATTYDDFIQQGGELDEIYTVFADQVVDSGTYKRGGITDVVANNITDQNAGIKKVTLNK